MPHGKKTVKLSRTASHRDAMLANMAGSLFLHSKLKTTTPKAKALKPLVDRLITTAKEGSLHSKRLVARVVQDKGALKKLFDEIVPKLQDRSSGYSRVIKAGFRRGDSAEVSVIELMIERPKAVAEKKEGRLKKLSNKLRRTPTSAATKEKHAAAGRSKRAAASKAKQAEEAQTEDETPEVETPETPEEESTDKGDEKA